MIIVDRYGDDHKLVSSMSLSRSLQLLNDEECRKYNGAAAASNGMW
jgi:hypothetical protein